MNHFRKTTGALLAIGFAAISLSLGATKASAQEAQPTPPPPPPTAAETTSQSLTALLELVRSGRMEENRVNAERERIFLASKSEQQSLISTVKAEIASGKRESGRLEGIFNENDLLLAQLEKQLDDLTGDFGELFGVVRQVAGDTRAQIEQSIISSQYPGRVDFLADLASRSELPRVEELEGLWAALYQEMVEQGKVIHYTANVANLEGIVSEQHVTRIGPFTAVSEGNYLQYNVPEGGGDGSLTVLGRQPQTGSIVGAAEDLGEAMSGGMVDAAIDPSRGSILGLLVQQPSLWERFQQGAIVGYAIAVLGSLGLALAIFLIVTLTLTSGRVKAQAKDINTPDQSNPLGRVIAAYMANKDEDTETLELKLDDAILKETPTLERGLSIVSVIAAVAPLLGLLGTVVGMIQTFQAITLFGTGDPKLMAGGISQALVTTVLGLTFAIPLLLLHSVAAGRSKSVIDTLEQQSAGMVAAHAEGVDHG